MRTEEEDAECKRLENEFNELRVKVCEQVEAQARANCPYAMLAVSDVRQLLHVLSLTPFHVKTMDEAVADLNARKRLKAAPRA